MTGASRATVRAVSATKLRSLWRRVCSVICEPSMTLSLKSDCQQAEDRHIKAQLCDCRMAEQLSEPAQAQDRSSGKDDGERHHRVADERRDEDAANGQLGKCVHH